MKEMTHDRKNYLLLQYGKMVYCWEVESQSILSKNNLKKIRRFANWSLKLNTKCISGMPLQTGMLNEAREFWNEKLLRIS